MIKKIWLTSEMSSLIELGGTQFADERFVILVYFGDVFLQMLHQSKLLLNKKIGVKA